MMNSTEMLVFIKVAQTNSFTEAGKVLGISRSATSKRVAQLEEHLGVKLVNRNSRSISLTDAGRVFYARSLEAEKALLRAEEAVTGADRQPQGVLRISVPFSLGASLVPSLVSELVELPELKVSAEFGEHYVDVVAGGYDVVIRLSRKMDDSNLVSKKLGATQRVLVAPPDYLEQHGVPGHVRELRRRDCLVLGYSPEHSAVWPFSGPAGSFDVAVRPAFSANNDLALILAACLGRGFLYIPRVHIGSELDRGRLKIVLPEFCGAIEYGIYAVYPQKDPPAKVRVFVEFVEKFLARIDQEDRWEPLK